MTATKAEFDLLDKSGKDLQDGLADLKSNLRNRDSNSNENLIKKQDQKQITKLNDHLKLNDHMINETKKDANSKKFKQINSHDFDRKEINQTKVRRATTDQNLDANQTASDKFKEQNSIKTNSSSSSETENSKIKTKRSHFSELKNNETVNIPEKNEEIKVILSPENNVDMSPRFNVKQESPKSCSSNLSE